MNIWLRLLIALAVGATSGVLAFAGIFYLFATFGSCPPEVHTCDLPMMAGFGLGLIVGPLVGIVAVWISFRRLGRRQERIVPDAI